MKDKKLEHPYHINFPPKIVQFQCIDSSIVALLDDGTLWERMNGSNKGWEEIDVPEVCKKNNE